MKPKRFFADLRHLFLNYFINRIPAWWIRKLLYKSFGLHIGRGSRIGLGVFVDSPRRIRIGFHTIVNEGVYLDGRGGLVLGDNCSISPRCMIITASHKVNSETFEYLRNQVTIGDGVWLGSGAIVLDGSVLGDGCVIGAGCVFKGRALAKGVYVGNPAKMIKERSIDSVPQINYKAFFR